jgi:hypothetical protein
MTTDSAYRRLALAIWAGRSHARGQLQAEHTDDVAQAAEVRVAAGAA